MRIVRWNYYIGLVYFQKIYFDLTKRFTAGFELAIEITKTIKASTFRLRVVAANSFFSISLILRFVDKALVKMYDLYLSSRSLKSIWTLFKVRINISKVIHILKSANKKVSSTKWEFMSLILTNKKVIIMPNISS